MAAFGAVQCVRDVTHDGGGLLDVVMTRDEDRSTVNVNSVFWGLSDHRMLTWEFQVSVTAVPPCWIQRRRSWKSFDVEVFRKDLMSPA